MKNQFIIPSIIIAAAIFGGFWMLKPPAELPKAPDTPIDEAIFALDLATVRQHLAAGLDVNARDGNGHRPLYYALSLEIDAIAEYLIDNGADVNVKLSGGNSYLHQIYTSRDYQMVKLLIAKGADVNARNEVGRTPLDRATLITNPSKIVELLRKHGGKSGAEFSIHVAAIDRNIKAIKQHLAAGTDVNAKWSRNGAVPLAYVIRGEDESGKEIAELLIANGADVNAKADNGKTPLDVATKTWAVDLLRKHGGKTAEELKAEGK